MKTNISNTLTLPETRKNQILSAATCIFAKEGYEKANTDQIAFMANLGKGTLYRYFKNKESLFVSVVARNFQKLSDAISISIKKKKDPISQLESLINSFLCFFDKNPEFSKIMIQVHEQSSLHKKIADIMLTHYCKDMKRYEEIIKSGIKRGTFKNIEAEKTINILMSILSGILHMHIFYKKKQKLIYDAPVVFKIFFTGILKSQTKGIKYE